MLNWFKNNEPPRLTAQEHIDIGRALNRMKRVEPSLACSGSGRMSDLEETNYFLRYGEQLKEKDDSTLIDMLDDDFGLSSKEVSIVHKEVKRRLLIKDK